MAKMSIIEGLHGINVKCATLAISETICRNAGGPSRIT